MNLASIQQRFKEIILDHPDVASNPPDDLAGIFESGEIALGDRLKVYRNNIVGSLTDVMVASFPAIEKLVGPEFMEGMARSFVLEHPPTQGCLNTYGYGFDAFIRGFTLAKGLPYLADIARLELALNAAYYAKDELAMDAADLGAIAPEELGNIQLFPRACVKLVQSPYPIHDIRDFAMNDGEGDAFDIDSGGAHLMVYRPKLDTEIIILDAGEFHMLDNLQNLMPLGRSVEETLAAYPDFDFEKFLQKHIFLETFAPLDSNIE